MPQAHIRAHHDGLRRGDKVEALLCGGPQYARATITALSNHVVRGGGGGAYERKYTLNYMITDEVRTMLWLLPLLLLLLMLTSFLRLLRSWQITTSSSLLMSHSSPPTRTRFGCGGSAGGE